MIYTLKNKVSLLAVMVLLRAFNFNGIFSFQKKVLQIKKKKKKKDLILVWYNTMYELMTYEFLCILAIEKYLEFLLWASSL